MDTRFELIVTIVNRGFSDNVMDAAKAAGARGGTILHARGTGIHEEAKFFGISIQPEKDMVMILVKQPDRDAIMHAISVGAGLNTEGRGLTFSLPVTDVAGIVHMMDKEKQEP